MSQRKAAAAVRPTILPKEDIFDEGSFKSKGGGGGGKGKGSEGNDCGDPDERRKEE